MRKTFSLPVAATAAGGGTPPPPPADTVDNIEHSVRFNRADSAQLSRTPSSTGNRKTWTWSAWVKRSALGDWNNLFWANGDALRFKTDDKISFVNTGVTVVDSTAVFRDTSAWYHVVCSCDTTLASNMVKIYVNNELVAQGNPFTQNEDTDINNITSHVIGAGQSGRELNGYLANIELIDGQALTPSSFGFTDSNNVWQPKSYTGNYNGPDINGATSPYVFPSSDPNSSYNSISSINSNSGNYAASVTGGASIKVKFASTQNNVTSISFRGGSWSQNALYDVYVNGTKVVNQASTASLWGEVTHNISSTNIDEFEIRGADGYSLAGLKFNGTLVSGTPSRGTSSYNGFHLDFADTSSATALGNDVSGNNNDFTPNNLVAGPAYTANSFSTEFDGTGDYLTVPTSTDLALGSGDWTVEAWVNADSTGYSSLITWRNASVTSLEPDLYVWNTGVIVWYANATALITGTTNIVGTGWVHVAVCKSGSSTKLFVNGTQEGSTYSDTNTYLQPNTTLKIGGFADASQYLDGKISNLRIIKGRALYTAAFTPPSTALTATDDTVLLTCQDATVRDNSNIGHDVTASGDVAVVNQGPFNGYSGSFDGTGDYLSVPANTVFDIGATKTWELWFKLDTVSNTKIYAGSLNNYWFNTGYTAMGGVANKIGFSAYTGSGWDAINSTTSLVAGSWYHVAATWDGTYFKLYLNGVLEATSSDLSARTWASNNGYAYEIGGIGSQSTTTIDGLISNHRVTDSVLYTADFTPPTADLTTTSQGATASNVKLLTCQNSTFIDNSPSAHTITANGNASTISVNPHTDKYSVTFDGTGDYLTVPASSDWEFTGDYTVEGWIYIKSASDWVLWETGGSGSADQFVSISNTIYWGFGTSHALTTTGFGSEINRWHHIAVCRSGSTVRLFKNGVVAATATGVSGTIGRSNAFGNIGIRRDNFYAIDGYISNLRIVKGQALYTSNFLPTKEDFTTTSQGATASNVKLLTCQSYKIQDNSPSAHTITVNGDAAPSTDAPFVTSGAGSFDGTGDYLSIADDADFDLGSGDFTIEGWFNIQSGNTRGAGWVSQWTSGLAWYFGTTDPSSVANKFVFGYSFDGSATGILDSGYVVTNSLNQWVHYAVSKSGTDVRLFVNGTQQGSTGTLSGTIYNSSDNIVIGLNGSGGSGWYFNGHMSNLRISKGLARYTSNFTPPTEDFDPTDQDTVLLALQDNTLDDLSGNDHAVTANGDAATSTVSPFEPVDGSDAMLDSPTNYGSGDTVRGNFCTWNPVHKNANASLSNGNLDYLATGGYPNGAVGTMAVSSGKWYFETICTANPYTPPVYYAAVVNTETFNLPSSGYVATTGFYAYSLREGGTYTDGSFTASGWSTGAVNDVIGVALDLDAGTVTFYKNNTLLGTLSGLSGSFAPFTASDTAASGGAGSTNFGQQPFKYPVAGYKAWCSTNLPTPAVADGSTAMDVVTYTGTSSGAVVSTPNMSPDVVWIKDRGNTFNHQLFDTIRGVNSSLLTNLTSVENNYNSFTSFDSTGFTVPNVNGTGANGNNHVAWTWDAGSSTVSNTDGTITSQVRANPTAGISIVSYVGTNSAGTVGHGLSNTPKMYIVKSRDTSFVQDWRTYHSGINDPSKYLQLHSTTESTTGTTTWNSTDPTSSIFNLGSGSTINTLNDNYIAYVFAPVEGFSAFGSFTGSTSNTFVYTGMRPRWLMIKRTDTTGNWQILDTEREGYNVDNDPLWANLATQEGTTDIADILSNGFKMRDGATGTYIYAAFAEHPFKTSRAR